MAALEGRREDRERASPIAATAGRAGADGDGDGEGAGPGAGGGILHAADALLPGGWTRDVLLTWDGQGRLTQVRAGLPPPSGVLRAAGPVLPGLPNLHSHAFQRAMAGLTERRAAGVASGDDGFWTWRELMYRFAARLEPDTLEAIATGLYVEMLEAGYTAVCEFHYLHRAPDGSAYDDPGEMSLALMRAAANAGIALTLLPALYQSAGFDGRPAGKAQRRFVLSTDDMLRLLARLRPHCRREGVVLGLAPHSLRAVPPEALAETVAALHADDAQAPVHIHLAEQRREVEESRAWSGQRPAAWLLDHAPVDDRWCLVHATHLDDDEARRAAACGAVAGLCPTTEANLGDGLFDLPRWMAAGGRWGVGSDSQVCVGAADELAWLEYGQRLATGRRQVAAGPNRADTSEALWRQAAAGGAAAAGRAAGALAPGRRADLLVLDAGQPALQGLPAADMLAVLLFSRAPRSSLITDVVVGGRWRVQQGRHGKSPAAAAALQAARALLLLDAGRAAPTVRPPLQSPVAGAGSSADEAEGRGEQGRTPISR